MEENTIFKPPAPSSSKETSSQGVVSSAQNGQSPSPTSTLIQTQPTLVSPELPPANTPPPSDSPSHGLKLPTFSIALVLKAIIGLAVFLVVLLIFLLLILPRFKGKKIEKVTLTYWGLWEEASSMQEVIADFQRQNPTITISYSKEDQKDYRERLVTRIQNGVGPDIFRFHNTWLPQLSQILLPLSSDVISPSEFAKAYYPVTQTDLIKNGAIYGIPLEIDTLALYINTDLFEAAGVKAPTTWDEFQKISRQLTVKDEQGKIKTSGAALGTFDNVTHAPDIVSLLLVQNGADIRNLSQTSKAASDALTFYTSFSKSSDLVWDASLDPSILSFGKGNLAMYFGYSWDVFLLRAMNPNLKFQIVEVPHLFSRDVSIASYWVEGISQKSKHQKESLLFLKYLAEKTTSVKKYTAEAKTRLFGEPYARIDLANSIQDNIFVAPFIKQAKRAQSSFFAGDTYDNGLNARMNGYLGNAVRSVLENTSPDSAVETLSHGVTQVLQQYGAQ